MKIPLFTQRSDRTLAKGIHHYRSAPSTDRTQIEEKGSSKIVLRKMVLKENGFEGKQYDRGEEKGWGKGVRERIGKKGRGWGRE